jgi:hypothetical protein
MTMKSMGWILRLLERLSEHPTSYRSVVLASLLGIRVIARLFRLGFTKELRVRAVIGVYPDLNAEDSRIR